MNGPVPTTPQSWDSYLSFPSLAASVHVPVPVSVSVRSCVRADLACEGSKRFCMCVGWGRAEAGETVRVCIPRAF